MTSIPSGNSKIKNLIKESDNFGKELKFLYYILEKFGEVRLVGGCVRDMLIGIEPKDVDIATSILPEKLIDILSKNEIKCFPTGIEFGTITAVVDQKAFEITTLRKDISTDGRRATVKFTNDWFEDAKRRDFTINAMYCDLNGNITDFFNGIDDLKNKKIKFIGDPEHRIEEDFLRILRYFRFFAYLGGSNIDESSFSAVIKLKSGLQKISGERIKAEMFKLFNNNFISECFVLFKKSGVDEYIHLPMLSNLLNINFVTGNYIVNLVLVFRALNLSLSKLEDIFIRWRLSNAEKKEFCFLMNYNYSIDLHEAINIHKREFYKINGYFENAVLINAAEKEINNFKKAKELICISKNWHYPIFPITGEDITALGFVREEIGIIKNKLLDIWIENDFSNSKEELLSMISKTNSYI